MWSLGNGGGGTHVSSTPCCGIKPALFFFKKKRNPPSEYPVAKLSVKMTLFHCSDRNFLTSAFVTFETSRPVNINDIPSLQSCNVNLISPLIWHEYSYFFPFLVTEEETNLSNSACSHGEPAAFTNVLTKNRSSMPYPTSHNFWCDFQGETL